MTTGNAYQVLPSFTDANGVTSAGPFLVPPKATTGQAITFSMSFLYTGDPSKIADYSVTTGSDFSLTFAVVNNAVVGTVTLGGGAGTNLWKCDAPSRAQLMANFVAFRDQVESQDEGAIAAGGAALIAGRVAEMMPAPIAETPFYTLGLVPGFVGAAPRVDLRAGMRLAVEYEATQFTSPSNTNFNGYIASGRSSYRLHSVLGTDGIRRLAFDPFLGSIAAPSIDQQKPVTPPWIASGLIDLQRATVGQVYWRVLYPRTMIVGNSQGSVGAISNVVLLGADTLTLLESATGSSTPVANTTSIVFRGRATVVPEILVSIVVTGPSGAATQFVHVPVGTTVAQVLERFTGWVPLDGNAAQATVGLNRLQSATSGNSTVHSSLVTFPNPASRAAFDLPLAPGDSVTLAFPPGA